MNSPDKARFISLLTRLSPERVVGFGGLAVLGAASFLAFLPSSGNSVSTLAATYLSGLGLNVLAGLLQQTYSGLLNASTHDEDSRLSKLAQQLTADIEQQTELRSELGVYLGSVDAFRIASEIVTNNIPASGWLLTKIYVDIHRFQSDFVQIQHSIMEIQGLLRKLSQRIPIEEIDISTEREEPNASSLLDSQQIGTTVSWANRQDLLALGCSDGSIIIQSSENLTVFRRISLNRGRINSLAWSHDGKFLAVGSDHAGIVLDISQTSFSARDLLPGERIGEVVCSSNAETIVFLVVVPTPTRLAKEAQELGSRSVPKHWFNIAVWNLRNETLERFDWEWFEYGGHRHGRRTIFLGSRADWPIVCQTIALSSEGRYLVAAGSPADARILSVNNLEPIMSLEWGATSGYISSAISNDEDVVALGTSEGSVYVWRDWVSELGKSTFRSRDFRYYA